MGLLVKNNYKNGYSRKILEYPLFFISSPPRAEYQWRVSEIFQDDRGRR